MRIAEVIHCSSFDIQLVVVGRAIELQRTRTSLVQVAVFSGVVFLHGTVEDERARSVYRAALVAYDDGV